MGSFKSGVLVAASLVLACSAPSWASSPPAKIALTGARIIPVVGEEIPSGTVLIEHGVITAVGPTVDIPYDAMEVDLTGKVIFPGLIDPHSWRGLDVPNETLPVTPFLDVYDAIDPSRLFFEDSLRDGVTSVHVSVADECVIGAVSRVVRPIGLTVEEMTVAPGVSLKIATTPRRGTDRMVQMSELRGAFLDLDDHLASVSEERYEKEREAEGKPVDVGPAEARQRGRALVRDEHIGFQYLNLLRLRRGDLRALISCLEPTDVAPAIAVAREQGFLDRAVLVLGSGAHKAAGEIAGAGVPVILDPALTHRERDPDTGELTETFVPKVFHDAGVTFALQPNPSDSLAERYLNYQAAACVRAGVPRQTALESITINPARMLGLGDRLGSIEPGKAGNIVVFSGDPLDFSSWVELVYIDGILAYDRSRDHRLQKLLELERSSAPKPDAQADDPGAAPPAEGGEPAPDSPDAPEDKTEEPAGEPAPEPSPAPAPEGGLR